MVRCHASLRATSATICSSTVTASTHAATSDSAAANSSRRPASTSTSTAAVASDPTTLIPPTAGHTPFANATHRVYMSATLGGGGELERAFGVQRIARIPVPAAWQRHGAGRRLFLMPAAAADGRDHVLLAATAAVRRTLLIAPSQAGSEEAASPVLPPDATRLGPDAIADGDVTSFLAPPRAALVLPNRYDGL